MLGISACNVSEFPDIFTIANELEILDLSHNKIHVSQNILTGPSSSCNLNSVVYVDSSNNSLSVVIPENLVNSTLNVLDLQMNELRCSISQTFPEDCNFNNLYLNGNQLEGPLPPSLVSYGYLNALDVENNKINVNFPDWSADLLELQVLIL
ncbi:hypothetical protein WN943_002191 [Citrus x changshan-huyou]